MNRFQNRIQTLRLARERTLTQGDLARAIGVAQSIVSRWESGEFFPDLVKALEVAHALGVSVHDLFPVLDTACRERVSARIAELRRQRLARE